MTKITVKERDGLFYLEGATIMYSTPEGAYQTWEAGRIRALLQKEVDNEPYANDCRDDYEEGEETRPVFEQTTITDC